MSSCLFCKIITKEIPSEIVFETEKYLGFKDISPSFEHHILIVPKDHIDSVASLAPDFSVCAEIIAKANDYAEQSSWPSYRLMVNNGPPFQEVFHLHFHLMSGQRLSSK